MVIFGAICLLFLLLSIVLDKIKPKQPTLNNIINQAQKNKGKFSNVYLDYELNQTIGRVYYISKIPNDPKDKKVFSVTENEFENFMYQKNNF